MLRAPLATAAAAALALADAPPAAAERAVVTAYGEGAPTTCVLDVEARSAGMFTTWNSSNGATRCTQAIQQSGQVLGDLGGGPLCSGFRATCTSSGGWDVYEETEYGREVVVRYEVALRAPTGQGWVAPADKCSGAGTDNLRCTFTASPLLITST